MACSAYFYINGTMSAVYAIGMTISAFMLYASLECAGNYSSLLHVVSVCVDKANAILELDTMDIDGKEIQPENYDIRLSNVSFSYDKRKIIDDISLSIPQKTTTAIVGPSGGGKSTLCNLIARFWDVDSGEVTLGGVNVKDYSMNSLMSNFHLYFSLCICLQIPLRIILNSDVRMQVMRKWWKRRRKHAVMISSANFRMDMTQ